MRFETVRRREFMTLLGGAAAAWPLVARAQQPTLPVVGFVSSRSLDGSARPAAAFSKGLSESGYVEGQNVFVEYHWLGGQNDRLPSLMADLVRRRVALSPPLAILLHLRPKLRPRRSRLPLASVETRSGMGWSPALPGRAATRLASIFLPRRSWPSGWGCCTNWCRRLFVLPCSSTRPILQAPSPRCEMCPKLPAQSAFKLRFSTPVPSGTSRRPSPLLQSIVLTPCSSPPTGFSMPDESNLRR